MSLGFFPPTTGKIILQGKDITGLRIVLTDLPGKEIAEGSPEEIREHKEVIEVHPGKKAL